MGGYFWTFCLCLALLCFPSCSKDSNPEVINETENNNDDTGGDDTGNDTGGDVINDPDCEYSGGEDYILTFSVEREFPLEMNIYLFDADWTLLEEHPLSNATNITFNYPGMANEEFHLLIHEYFYNTNASISKGKLFLSLPPGEYHDRSFHEDSPTNYQLGFPIQNIGSLPFKIRNWNQNILPQYYSSNNGGTYFFGQDYTSARNYYPDHKGYFLTLDASGEEQDRYLWTELPGNITGINYQSLPMTTQTIQVALDPDFLVNPITQANIYGFVPQNESLHFGNQLGYFDSDVHSNLTYSVPGNLFTRYRFEVESKSWSCSSCDHTYYMSRNSETPITEIQFPDWSSQVTSTANNDADVQANLEGDYDAFTAEYSYYFSDPYFEEYTLSVIGPNPGQTQMSYNLPFIITNDILDCFPCMNFGRVSLMGYEETECYRSFLKTHLYSTSTELGGDRTKQGTFLY